MNDPMKKDKSRPGGHKSGGTSGKNGRRFGGSREKTRETPSPARGYDPKRDKNARHRGPAPSGGSAAKPARAEPLSLKAAPVPRLKIDLFGVHAVREALANPCRKIHSVYATEQSAKTYADVFSRLPGHLPPRIVTREQLDRSLPPGTVHQGVAIACDPLPEIGVDDFIIAANMRPRTVLVMLDQVTDPHNVGAILRSCSAFGANGMILQRMHAPELTGVLAKTACGAVEHVPVAYETNLTRTLETLQEAGFMAVGLDERGDKGLFALRDAPKLVIVLGAEGDGIRRLVKERCDRLASLPTSGPIASLNVSNAAAVALFASFGDR
jgi:23S rRNA (guanosine2251-2'-O)-methyltransferase